MLSARHSLPRDSRTCWPLRLYPRAASCPPLPLPGVTEPAAPEGVLAQEGNPQLSVQAARKGQQLPLCCGAGVVATGRDDVRLWTARLQPSGAEGGFSPVCCFCWGSLHKARAAG